MQLLNYEQRSSQRPTNELFLFWLFFIIGGLVGLISLNVGDDVIMLNFYHRRSDGGASILGLCAVPVFAVFLIVVFKVARVPFRHKSVSFMIGLFAPWIAYGVLWAT